jgi:hypothetical protein
MDNSTKTYAPLRAGLEEPLEHLPLVLIRTHLSTQIAILSHIYFIPLPLSVAITIHHIKAYPTTYHYIPTSPSQTRSEAIGATTISTWNPIQETLQIPIPGYKEMLDISYRVSLWKYDLFFVFIVLFHWESGVFIENRDIFVDI